LKIHESAENYLEMILILTKRNGSVRSVEVAQGLGFSKPSVSVAMKNLRGSGHIRFADDGSIELTALGREVAELTYSRHILIKNFLISLGVDDRTAEEDACRAEHILSQQSIDALQNFISQRGAKND
jgi:Mn-dependent DtxR family transcriptional regulator